MLQVKHNSYDKTLAKGGLVNALGIVGKAMFPLFFILAGRLYGIEISGLFYLALTIIEVSISFVSSGFTGGAVMFASRYCGNEEKEDALYNALANAFVITLGISLVLVLAGFVGGPEFLLQKYSQEFLVETVQMMVVAVPLIVFSQLVVNSTKAHLTMKWDALLFGFVRPLVMVTFSLLFYWQGIGLKGLVFSYLIAQAGVAVFSVFLFSRYFSYAKLFFHIRRFQLFKPLLAFSIPQNLNMTFNTLITNLDVLMLGYFGRSEGEIFIYGMGAQLVRNIRQVKLALSSSFVPLIAKFHEQNAIDAMNDSFSLVSRWIISLGLPLAFVVGMMRSDLLQLFAADYTGETYFMLLLLLPPLLSCGFGLAGNIVVMTGHSQWNLLNSVTVAVVNASLNYMLIPRWGMMGAATATVIASFSISMLQLVEAYKLVGTHLILKQIYKPWLAGILAVSITLGLYWITWQWNTLALRIGLSAAAMIMYGTLLVLFGIDERDKRVLLPWRKGTSSRRQRLREESPES